MFWKRKPLKPDSFYTSRAWYQVRYEALRKYGARCMCCGLTPPRVKMHIDHIKPRSKYPKLELLLDNLQVLCEYCNLGKSNIYEDDWRKK